MDTVISIILGAVAPFVLKFLNSRVGLKGVPMLWVMYTLSVAVAVGVSAFNGQLDPTNVLATVAVVTASAQTTYQAFKKFIKAPA